MSIRHRAPVALGRPLRRRLGTLTLCGALCSALCGALCSALWGGGGLASLERGAPSQAYAEPRAQQDGAKKGGAKKGGAKKGGAKKGGRRGAGSFDRRRRAAAALIKSGHPAIELSVRTDGAAAQVYHGRELLGTTPLSLSWPKNTGALDLVVSAPGHIPVNTRLYTYKSDNLTVKMFREDQGHLVFGFKKKVEEDALGGAAAPPEAP